MAGAKSSCLGLPSVGCRLERLTLGWPCGARFQRADRSRLEARTTTTSVRDPSENRSGRERGWQLLSLSCHHNVEGVMRRLALVASALIVLASMLAVNAQEGKKVDVEAGIKQIKAQIDADRKIVEERGGRLIVADDENIRKGLGPVW